MTSDLGQFYDMGVEHSIQVFFWSNIPIAGTWGASQNLMPYKYRRILNFLYMMLDTNQPRPHINCNKISVHLRPALARLKTVVEPRCHHRPLWQDKIKKGAVDGQHVAG